LPRLIWTMILLIYASRCNSNGRLDPLQSFLPRLALNHVLPDVCVLVAFPVTRITGVYHQCLDFFLKTGSCCVAQAGFELVILLPHPSKCWDYRQVPPCPTFTDTSLRATMCFLSIE
jgi:hypothetical protein